MIENLIVFSALAFAAVFFVAWLLNPRLRAWLERPKHRFQANVQDYEQIIRKGGRP
jgi:hypothetical protein